MARGFDSDEHREKKVVNNGDKKSPPVSRSYRSSKGSINESRRKLRSFRHGS
ncbi:hypothetical protein GW765_01635 [Candidatus Parcubacteria bacterium]|nr:hypothetical protein [Candidatus Parcubacteria bacterium]